MQQTVAFGKGFPQFFRPARGPESLAAILPAATVTPRNIDHLKTDRAEQDILFELLLKLGLDPCVPIETRIFNL